jgi:hypothetical protein
MNLELYQLSYAPKFSTADLRANRLLWQIPRRLSSIQSQINRRHTGPGNVDIVIEAMCMNPFIFCAIRPKLRRAAILLTRPTNK